MADNRARPADQALAVPVEPVSRLDPAGFDPSRKVLTAEGIIQACETYEAQEQRALLTGAAILMDRDGKRFRRFLDAGALTDAALELLPVGADWRRLTPNSASTYAANPYNAAAQKRHDGFGGTVALQFCSAALKVWVEPIRKAIAMEARQGRDAEERPDPKDDSAGRKASPKGEGQ